MVNLVEIIKRHQRIFRRSYRKSRPVEFDVVYLGVTDSCTRTCPHCYYGEDKETAMDASLIENLLRFALDNHVFSVAWAGKEPLVRFDDLIKPFILDNRFRDILFMFHTNGDLLTESVADVMDIADNCEVHLSLEGTEREEHDSIKGGGSYEATMNAIELLYERAVPYGFFITIRRDNFDHMEDLVEHAIKLGAVTIHIVGYKAIGPNANLDQMLTPQQESKRYDLKKAIKRKYPYLSVPTSGCNIGIRSDGYYTYCPFLVGFISDNRITPGMPHEEILHRFRGSKERFGPLLSGVEECPLIENPTGFMKYVKSIGTPDYRDMLMQETPTHRRAVETADEFRKLRAKEQND